jgi:hypothetical protein
VGDDDRAACLPGRRLLSAAPLLAALLIVVNDLWLKRWHPGLVSGKLSDVGLGFFFPVLLATSLEWLTFAIARLRRRAWRSLPAWADGGACVVAAAYYTLLKCWPAASAMHALWLARLFGRPFAAVSDVSDLVLLPLFAGAYLYLRRAVRREAAVD